MLFILIFSCLWPFILPEENCGDLLRRDIQFMNLVQETT